MKEEDKPPVGVMPRNIWLEKRRDDLSRAVTEYFAYYAKTGKEQDWAMISRWVAELALITAELKT